MTLDLARAYDLMSFIRYTEEKIAEKYGGWDDTVPHPMRTPVHLSIGQEAASVGVIMALPQDAHVFASHRNHAAYLAKGGDLDAMIAELYGKATGCTGGRGGSMHLWDKNVNVMGHPIVGDSISLAVGSALAAKMEGTDRVTAVFFGDGAAESGQFWEALNFAAVQKLPILFVCENNEYATHTHIRQRQPDTYIRKRVAPWLPMVCSADGNEVGKVYDGTRSLLKSLPAFLEVHTYRYKEHVGPNDDSDLGYRSLEEVEFHKSLDPISQKGFFYFTSDVYEGSMKYKVDKAFVNAEMAPWPEVAV